MSFNSQKNGFYHNAPGSESMKPPVIYDGRRLKRDERSIGFLPSRISSISSGSGVTIVCVFPPEAAAAWSV